MSYDISIVDEEGNVIEVERPHNIRGGTFAANGSNELSINITYNYARYFREVIDPQSGIRHLYGMNINDSIPIIVSAIENLRDEEEPESTDYWKPTKDNARKALLNMMSLVMLCLHENRGSQCFWTGD